MKKIICLVLFFAFIANVSAQFEVDATGNTHVGGNLYLESDSGIIATTNSNVPITFKVNGVWAGSTGHSGKSNVSFGYRALSSNTGNFNTANGYYALYANTAGNNNTAIGYYADVSSGDLSNATASVAACVPGNTYGTVSGTSFAAPQVAGVAADVENIIKATTDSIADGYLYPGKFGAGRVNAYKVLQAACATATSPVNFTNRIVTTNTTVNSCGDINAQNVTVANGAKLTLDAAGKVNIISNFEVELGPEFKIIK